MLRNQVEKIMEKLFSRIGKAVSAPTASSWTLLEKRFSTEFPDTFKYFMDLCYEYDVDWQFLSIDSHSPSGNETITTVYDHEMQRGDWPEELIPFHDIGNGDFYCLNAIEGKNSKVYIYHHDKQDYLEDSKSVGEWILKLEEVFG